MAAVSIAGNDTIIINERVMTNFANTDVGMLEYPNEKATVVTGKNGNAVYSPNSTGEQGNLTLRFLRGTADDKYLNGLLINQFADFPSFVLMTGSFIKRMGTGTGETFNDTYILSGGIFTKNVDVKSNVEGDVEEAITIYTMQFARVTRTIG